MTNYKVYLVAKATQYDSFEVCGLPFANLLKQEFGADCEVIASPSEAKEGGITAVLYASTPLVTRAFLDDLAARVTAGEQTGYQIGEGYLKKAGAPMPSAKAETLVVQSFADLNTVLAEKQAAILERHFQNGVRFVDPRSCHIDFLVEIGEGATIFPMNFLRGRTKIGKRVEVRAYCDLTNVEIGDDSDIASTFGVDAKIGEKTTVGPFACLRKGAIIGDRCRVGDFVEVKNSTFANDVKAAHLAYVGDSFVGENTNIGCGVIFANYNGKVKQSVVVGKDVFIGCNTNLIAPLRVEDNAYIAAGSTVTQDVPEDSLCIARARQVVKEGWARPRKED